MQSDNKVSSLFLLVLIGLAIYYFLNNDNFSPLNTLKENFDDPNISLDNEVNNIENKSVLPSTIMHSNMGLEMQDKSLDIQYDNANHEPYVPQSVINDIAVNQTQPPGDIYTFQPNDESDLGVNGSSLNDAFALPIPNGTNTNEIDFKKQNVDNYNARDFLPREVNDDWFETDFSLAKYQLNDDKLINTERYIIGINTVGQSLKNPSWDIRGTISNPKVVVSPWNNSTYEPDFNLKPLC